MAAEVNPVEDLLAELWEIYLSARPIKRKEHISTRDQTGAEILITLPQKLSLYVAWIIHHSAVLVSFWQEHPWDQGMIVGVQFHSVREFQRFFVTEWNPCILVDLAVGAFDS